MARSISGVMQRFNGAVSIGRLFRKADTNYSAAGVSSQSAATPLQTDLAYVGTVAANAGVQLPLAVAGAEVVIVNAGANTLKIWPLNGSGDAIDSGAANANTTLTTANRIATFRCFVNGTWISSLGGAVSS